MLITDLDNTLYDWVSFFSRSFSALVQELSLLLHVDEERLLDEFKAIHQKYGNTEQPFAMLELPSVQNRFGNMDRGDLIKELERPAYAFNKTRKKHLKLYDSVNSTLTDLTQDGVRIVGYTEAIMENAFYRLYKLGIVNKFTRIYTLEGNYLGHPDPERTAFLSPPKELIRIVPRIERKPNPELLLDICRSEGIEPDHTWYIGDSLVRDISMARSAGIKSIWAKYGTEYDPSLWSILVRVTHWTKEDVSREAELKKRFDKISPDYTINMFGQVIDIIGGGYKSTSDK